MLLLLQVTINKSCNVPVPTAYSVPGLVLRIRIDSVMGKEHGISKESFTKHRKSSIGKTVEDFFFI